MITTEQLREIIDKEFGTFCFSLNGDTARLAAAINRALPSRDAALEEAAAIAANYAKSAENLLTGDQLDGAFHTAIAIAARIRALEAAPAPVASAHKDFVEARAEKHRIAHRKTWATRRKNADEGGEQGRRVSDGGANPATQGAVKEADQ